MKQSGHPYREDEPPDSPFGKVLKNYLRRVRDFTQAEVARETFIPAFRCLSGSKSSTIESSAPARQGV